MSPRIKVLSGVGSPEQVTARTFVNAKSACCQKSYGIGEPHAVAFMAGIHPLPRSEFSRAFWPRELGRAALLLGASAALLWSSFAIGRWIVSFPELGPIYLDLLLAWGAILLHVSAWPNLWIGLRDLRVRRPLDGNSIVAWRSFLLTLAMIGAAVLVLPLEYHAFTSTEAWLLIVYITAFPYLGWTFVPILALHGILFGRVANFLESRSRQMATAGALVLFAVAAATAAVVFQNPGATAFARTWSVGRGLLPAAALAGYLLIAVGITAQSARLLPGASSWTTRRRVRW